jgi:hypothetical protein
MSDKRIDAVWEVIRDTYDTYAPDHPPHEVMELLELLETALEKDND